MIKLSIIIPVYNGEKYISECVDSIFNTKYIEEFEVIIVNDGSYDNTLNICKKYSLTYKELKKGINEIILDGSEYVFADSIKFLEDLKQTGKFWLRGYKCDIKSLKKFLSILYPTAEYFKATINEQTK